MPFYEYLCQTCAETFETLRPMQERDRSTPCPKCGSTDVTRQVSVFSASVSSGGGIPQCGNVCESSGGG